MFVSDVYHYNISFPVTDVLRTLDAMSWEKVKPKNYFYSLTVYQWADFLIFLMASIGMQYALKKNCDWRSCEDVKYVRNYITNTEGAYNSDSLYS